MRYDVVEKDVDYALRMKNPFYGTVEADSYEKALALARRLYGGRSLTGLRLVPLPDPHENARKGFFRMIRSAVFRSRRK